MMRPKRAGWPHPWRNEANKGRVYHAAARFGTRVRATRARIHAKIQVASRTCELHLVAWASRRPRPDDKREAQFSIINFALWKKELRPFRVRKREESGWKREKGRGKRGKREARGGAHSCSLVLIIHKSVAASRPIKDTRAFIGRTSRGKRAFATERR